MPDIPDTDLSGQLLDNIFGNGWELIVPGSSIPEETVVSTFVFPLFQMLNAVVLTATAIMVGYVFCFGVVGTANEGVPLGRRFHSMWVPIRAAMGVTWLIPLPYISILQIMLLTCISWSISFANEVWSTGLDYLETNTGFIATAETEDTAQVENIAAGIMDNLIIQHYYDHKLDIPTENNVIYETITKNGEHQIYFVFYPPDTDGIVTEDMGQILLNCEDPEGQLCSARYDALEQLVKDLVPISLGIIGINTASYSSSIPTADDFNDAVETYRQTVANNADAYFDEKNTDITEKIHEFVEEAKQLGWSSAGAWYWNMARIQAEASDEISNIPEVDSFNENVLNPSVSFGQINEYLTAAEAYRESATQSVEGSPGSKMDLMDIRGGDDGIKWLLAKLNFSNGFVDLITDSDSDIVTSLASTGHTIIGMSELLLGAAALIDIGQETIKQADNSFTGIVTTLIPGLSMKKKIVIGVIIGTLKFLGKVVFLLIFILFPLGVGLAFYLPAVPLLLWVMSVLNWLILILETLVAAPLWAAAHAMPSGEGLAGDHGKPGYYIFIQILLRPVLMVTGLLLSIIVLKCVGAFIGECFNIFSEAMNDGYLQGPVTQISMMFVFGSLAALYAHRIFSLIFHLPDNVMRWVGGNIHSMGESMDVDKMKNQFGSFLRENRNWIRRSFKA
ncbi:DotA protein (plasmid) [Desulfosarcina ovata subsp. sediminis]|uniref:DotA protein n=1 Tax=Desulfosarcina ovata subsp. sediminis TaxID=885957 RepID=A0A5K8A2K2_9BACT|nr:DotA/TraY family protein [Desulfosarcina ovata]BBO86762.1 DotA protein [Desulfosarcina ovata subsp. sediminis]